MKGLLADFNIAGQVRMLVKQVQSEFDLLRQQQATVKQTIEKGSYVQKAAARFGSR